MTGRPVEEERFSTHLIRDNWAKFGDATVETIAEIIPNNEERTFRDFCGFEHGVVGWIVFLPSGLSQEANIQGDPYLYADTSILRNLAGIRDANGLSKFESDHFFAGLLDLHENPVSGFFDSDHLRHIHRLVYCGQQKS